MGTTHPRLCSKRCTPVDVLWASATLTAAESALREGHLLAFPGRGTTTLWRARRLAPTKLTGLLDAVVKRQNHPR